MNLGALPSPKDIRDIKLGAVQDPVPFPNSFLPDITGTPNYYQGHLPTCGAHAGTWLKTRQEIRECGNAELSPQYLWIKVKEIDGFPPEEGTDMRSIFKRLADSGICDFSLFPDSITSSLPDYSDKSHITSEMDDNAQPRIINSYAFVDDMSWDGLKRATYQNKEVLLLISFDDTYFGHIVPPAPQTEPYGHFVICYGYDENYIYIADSCEQNIPYRKLTPDWLPHIKEAGTCIDLSDVLVKKLTQELSILQQLVLLYQKLVGLLKK